MKREDYIRAHIVPFAPQRQKDLHVFTVHYNIKG
jgi:hypothetical protein